MTLILPAYLPSEQEIKDCSEYIPIKISAYWKSLKPSVLRTLIYRSILSHINTMNKYDRIQQSDLLVLAELNPPVWGKTRNMDEQVVLHDETVCLTCNTTYQIPQLTAGTRFPLLTLCGWCYKTNKELSNQTIPFLSTFHTWPTYYQEECLKFILNTCEEN